VKEEPRRLESTVTGVAAIGLMIGNCGSVLGTGGARKLAEEGRIVESEYVFVRVCLIELDDPRVSTSSFHPRRVLLVR
jgi:hypothetical protein